MKELELNKDRLFISFSGGRSSAVMTYKLWEKYKDTKEICILFANTGCEHPETLEFIHKCEVHFGWPIVWLEARVIYEKGVGVRHTVVDYETAARSGEPFEAVIKKYGIFNKVNPACTSRLKVRPMQSYLKSLGWRLGKKVDHMTAIGIRADEIDRQSPIAKETGYFYPLITWGMTKRDIGTEIRKWPFDLEIPSDAFGNCVWCWKKSHRKHLTLASIDETIFDFPAKMERIYGDSGAHRKSADDNGKTWFFRDYKSVSDIVTQARLKQFTPYSDDLFKLGLVDFDQDLDIGGGCGENCEIGTDAAYIEEQLNFQFDQR
jgi:hypothetical protein